MVGTEECGGRAEEEKDMFLRILKKDLKRNKTMNVILFLFTVLAAVFVASGLNNLVSVISGTDYYLDQANVGDYVIIASTGEDVSSIKNVLDSSSHVKSYRLDKVCFGKSDVVRDQNGKAFDNDNTTILQAIGRTQMNFFNTDDQSIQSVEKGKIYLPSSFVRDQGLRSGDTVEIHILDCTKRFIVAGGMKDAMLGSTFMGNNRVLMNDEDYDEILQTEGLSDYEGCIVNVDSDDPMGCKADFANVDRILFDDVRSTIKITYVLDLIVAFIVVILSICLMVVSFVLIRFSITFAITEDFREIGVMKAIGIRERKIRSLYMVKYVGLGILGCFAGCIISFPFGRFLMKNVTENMVLGNSYGNLMNLLGSAIVFGLIVGFAYLATGRLKRMTPTDAIRSGETGERFTKKGGLRISKSRGGNCFYLALNDILSSPGRFMNILISFTLCTLFVLITSNTVSTMDSNSCIDAFGTRADLYVTDDSISMDFMYRENGKEMMTEHLDEMEKELAQLGMPGKVSIEMIYKFKFTLNGKTVRYSFQQGLHTKTSDYAFEEGSAPRNKNEIAITRKVANDMGLKIGDVIEIDFGDRKEKCTVTAMFQSLNLLGSIIILHEDAPTSFDYVASFMQYKISFTDDPDDETIEARKERLKKVYDNDQVMDQREYCIDSMKSLDTVQGLEKLLLGITLIVIVLVTILMERSFISDEKKEIAILKAVGFRDGSVIAWQVIRFGIVCAISMVIAMVLSIPVTKLTMTPVFGMMGADHIEFIYSIKSLFRYPAIIFGATIAIAFLTALYTGTIKARDTASIE